MPTAANITVKKADGTTDLVYVTIDPAGSDSPASWRALAVGDAVAHQPRFTLLGKLNANRTVTRFKATFMYPEVATNSTTGITSVVNVVPLSAEFTLPLAAKSLTTKEAIYQFTNLLASALVKQCLETQANAN